MIPHLMKQIVKSSSLSDHEKDLYMRQIDELQNFSEALTSGGFRVSGIDSSKEIGCELYEFMDQIFFRISISGNIYITKYYNGIVPEQKKMRGFYNKHVDRLLA